MKYKLILSLFFFITVNTYVHPVKIGPIIKESEIPLPEVHYELPEKLIGDFIMITKRDGIEITIYPNNKYILLLYELQTLEMDYYGHIVKIDDTFYFSPSPDTHHSFFYKQLTEIHLTDSGFFFYEEEQWPIRSIRKENIPKPECLADEVSVSHKLAKRQYFCQNGLEINYGEIDYIEQLDTIPFLFYHFLTINNGIVTIIWFADKKPILAEGGTLFEGFLEIIEENTDITKGIIHFTNGSPYYYISDGTAEIEINRNGNVKITMLYSDDPILLKGLRIPEGFKFPAKLILEF